MATIEETLTPVVLLATSVLVGESKLFFYFCSKSPTGVKINGYIRILY